MGGWTTCTWLTRWLVGGSWNGRGMLVCFVGVWLNLGCWSVAVLVCVVSGLWWPDVYPPARQCTCCCSTCLVQSIAWSRAACQKQRARQKERSLGAVYPDDKTPKLRNSEFGAERGCGRNLRNSETPTWTSAFACLPAKGQGSRTSRTCLQQLLQLATHNQGGRVKQDSS
jgi:hypothetical protein